MKGITKGNLHDRGLSALFPRAFVLFGSQVQQSRPLYKYWPGYERPMKVNVASTLNLHCLKPGHEYVIPARLPNINLKNRCPWL